MGGSFSTAKSKSSAKTSQDVWGPQGDALENLYGSASDWYNNLGQYTGNINNQAGQASPYMQEIAGQAQGGFQNMLGGGSIGDTSDIRNQLMDSMRQTSGGSNMGKMYQDIVGGEGNTYIDPMVNAMKDSSMDNLNRMQSGTGLAAAEFGQGGSSRHAMQNAMQAGQANQDMLNRETQMRGGAYDTDMGWKMKIAQQADQGVQQTQNRLAGMLGSADTNVGTGLHYGQGMQNLGMGQMAPWLQAQQASQGGLGQYANVIGAPTVLGSGKSSGSAKSGGVSGSITG